MTQFAFSLGVEAALNRYTVAALPEGFSDRLMARLEAGGLFEIASTHSAPIPPRRTKGFSGPWARSGKILGSTALFGLVTAAAAASGLLGEPIYVPGVSEVLAKAEIITPNQIAKAVAKPVQVTNTKKPVETAVPAVEPPKGKDAVKALVAQLRDDPEYRALPRKAQIAIARAEAVELVRSGAISGPELREAVREMRAEARPVIKAKIDEVVARRRVENSGSEMPKRPPAPKAEVKPGPDGQNVKSNIATPAATKANNDRIRALRERYRNASPEERAVIRQRIRERAGAGVAPPSDAAE